jgi:hypothetical protein
MREGVFPVAVENQMPLAAKEAVVHIGNVVHDLGYLNSCPHQTALRFRRNLIYLMTRRISRVMIEHKIFCAVARLNDDAAMRSLLQPIKDVKNMRTVLRMVRTSILCPIYDEEMRVARYIVLDISNHIVGCHSVTDISRQQAKKITAGCVSVSRWSPAAFDAVVGRVLGGTTRHVH